MTTPVYMKTDKENQIMEFVLPKKFNNKEIPIPVNNNLEVYKSEEEHTLPFVIAVIIILKNKHLIQ